MIINSSDVKYNDSLAKATAHFGEKTVVTRQELLDYQMKTGNNFPKKFWDVNRIGRGVFSLKPKTEADVAAAEENVSANVVHISKAHNHVDHSKQSSDTISKFSIEEMIPAVKDTFVEWGNFSTVKNLIASGEFFTLYVTGESGSGKNEMIDQACAKLKKPIVRVSITRETKEEHLIGSKTLVDGSIKYEEGPVKWAAENGAVLLIDEISAGDPNELMCLQNVLEGQPFFVKAANVLVKPAPGFCIIATDNTKGRGDESGRHIGTNILNDAFLERFEMTMEQGYPNERTEAKIISRLMEKIGLEDETFAKRLVTWVQAIRKTYMDEGLEEQITTRRACHIVRTYKKLRKADTAIELCINRFDSTTIQAMLSLWEKLEYAPVDDKSVDNGDDE